jgi:CRISPR-associated protein Cas2
MRAVRCMTNVSSLSPTTSPTKSAGGRVFKAMHGYGEWLQLSVFQCRLSQRRRVELETRLRELVKNGEDHILLIDVGPADKIELAMESIGKTFSKMERRATVI